MLPSDPDMLASFLNMKLRDQYASLDALCDDLELITTIYRPAISSSEAGIDKRLKQIYICS